MAINLTGQPWVFDAALQEYVRDAAATRGPVGSLDTKQKIYVDHIHIESGGTGGTYEVLDIVGGRSLTGPILLGADAEKTIIVGHRVRGVHISQFGTDGTISVFHGDPGA